MRPKENETYWFSGTDIKTLKASTKKVTVIEVSDEKIRFIDLSDRVERWTDPKAESFEPLNTYG